ncbi:MAG: hypothetical protein D6720_10125 [Gammaproteobacteria bacterium]|nr:MAG: hypothetical protein D6720_10125 [Gammaproteobacteria bacterium]
MGTVRRVLRPLARLMIRHGITLPAIVELLKQVMVDVAIHDFPVEGKRTTDSRISVLTGVHRKDVKRFREMGFRRNDVPKRVSVGMQLVNAWMTAPGWQDEEGHPLVLPRDSKIEGEKDFDMLANQISSDVRPRAILDELLRVGVVVLEEDRVRLVTEAFVPTESEAEKLYYFEQAAYAHLMAGVRNLEGHQPSYFDRVVQYHSIPPEALPAIRAILEDDGMTLLKKINRRASAAKDSSAGEPRFLAVGLYYYDEPASDEEN